MAMEQGLYAQVVMLRRKDLKFTESNKNKNEAKFKFQCQSARSQRWFDLDFDWIEINFSTREPDFYKKIFQIHAIGPARSKRGNLGPCPRPWRGVVTDPPTHISLLTYL